MPIKRKLTTVPKNKRKYRELKYWTDLKKGDKIEVKGGPYYFCEKTNYTYNLGHEGIFIVDSLDENGIHADPIDFYGGHSYIYMGPDVPGLVGMKVAHKIKLMEN